MELHSETKKIQEEFAEYCKTGILKELPGITPNRLHHYRRLVYNVINGTLEQAFPLTLELLTEDQWDSWVDKFFSDADLVDPQLFRMPERFYEWSVQNNMASRLEMPFLEDLLLLEWVEIEVHTMEDSEYPSYTFKGDIMSDTLLVNPDYRILELNFPVHLYPAHESAKKQGKYYVLVFREPIDARVEFINLSILHVFLIQKILEEETSLVDLLPEVVKSFSLDNNEDITGRLLEFVKSLIQKGFVLGYQK